MYFLIFIFFIFMIYSYFKNYSNGTYSNMSTLNKIANNIIVGGVLLFIVWIISLMIFH